MTGLAEFLLARLAEDEGWARAASPWATGSRDYEQPVDWRRHMWNWSPARVLAECEAKRRLISFAADLTEDGTEDLLSRLALPYADHPTYREEWRP